MRLERTNAVFRGFGTPRLGFHRRMPSIVIRIQTHRVVITIGSGAGAVVVIVPK
jgi:hypothetical protein